MSIMLTQQLAANLMDPCTPPYVFDSFFLEDLIANRRDCSVCKYD